MKYEIEKWNNRTVFVFRQSMKTFEDFLEIIETTIKPDYRTEIEITSWTEGFAFLKNEVEIYFENFYDEEDPILSFELLPIGNDNEPNLKVLKQIMNKIPQNTLENL